METKKKAEAERKRLSRRETFVLFTEALILFSFLVFPFLTDHGRTATRCAFHELTGLSCPTCGMSRSLWAWTHLEVREAFIMHLFGPVVYTTAVILFFLVLGQLLAGRKIRPDSLQRKRIGKLLFVFLEAWVFYWFLRMLLEYMNIWPVQ